MRQKKEAKYLNVYIEKSIHDELAALCEELGQSKTVATERALRMYIDANKKKVSDNDDSK